MASKTLGRVTCPIGCGHNAAQVKIKTDKADGREAHPYVHCAGCGIQLHTRNREQAAHLVRGMRPEKGMPDAEAKAPQDGHDSAIEPAPAQAKRAGWSFGSFAG